MRTNLAAAFQYLVFLAELERTYILEGTAKYLIFKDIMLHTGSVVECILNFTLQILATKDQKLKNRLLIEHTSYARDGLIHKLTDGKEIVYCTKTKTQEAITGDTKYNDLNRLALSTRLFNRRLFGKSDTIRKIRNRIHLCGLDSVEDYYTKKDIEKIFSDAKEIIDCCESKLAEYD